MSSAGEGWMIVARSCTMLTHDLDVTLFVACYNEADNIVGTLESIRQAMESLPLKWEAIVIDDCSHDDSVDIVQDYIRAHPNLPIHLVVNQVNRGLAQNYIEGAFLGRGKYYRLVCGDNVEDAAVLRAVLASVGLDDMVLFYHSFSPRTWVRRLLSQAYTTVVNCITGNSIRYYNGGAIHLRYNVMRWHTNYHGFGFQADLICRLIDEGFTYTEVPIIAAERANGKSNALRLRNILSVTHTLTDLIIRRIARSPIFGGSKRSLPRAGRARPGFAPVEASGPDASQEE